MLIDALFKLIVKKGRLTVIDSKGRAHVFGPGPEPSVTMRLHDPSLEWRLFFQAPVLLGEAYMDGRLTIEDGQDRRPAEPAPLQYRQWARGTRRPPASEDQDGRPALQPIQPHSAREA